MEILFGPPFVVNAFVKILLIVFYDSSQIEFQLGFCLIPSLHDLKQHPCTLPCFLPLPKVINSLFFPPEFLWKLPVQPGQFSSLIACLLAHRDSLLLHLYHFHLKVRPAFLDPFVTKDTLKHACMCICTLQWKALFLAFL